MCVSQTALRDCFGHRLSSACCLFMQSGLKTGNLLVRLSKVLLHSAMVLLLTFTINYLAKVLPFLFSSRFFFLSPTLLLVSLLSFLLIFPSTSLSPAAFFSFKTHRYDTTSHYDLRLFIFLFIL